MSTTQRYSQDDETVARQLGFLLAKGLDRDAALKQLGVAAPPELQHSIETIVTRLEPSNRDPHLTAQFIRQATALGGEPGKGLASMSAMSAEAGILADNLYRSIKPGLVYVALVAFFGFYVSMIWQIFIWPQFEHFYAGFDIPMPGMTQIILNLGFFGFPLAFLLLFLSGVLLWVMAHLRSRQLSRLEPLRFRLFNSKLAQAGNTWLTLGLCDALHKAGIDSEAGLAEAEKLLAADIGPIIGRDLALANKTDTFRDELQYQISNSSKTIDTMARVEGLRELWALRIVLYVMIAIAVFSFYVPIFFMPGAMITG